MVHKVGDQQSAYHTHEARYTELCDAMMQCKGAVSMMADARVFTKKICCVARHPDKSRPQKLADAPGSMGVWPKLLQAQEFLQDSGSECRWDDAAPSSLDSRRRLRVVTRALKDSGMAAREVDFVELVLISRGAAKAMWMWDEAAKLETILSEQLFKWTETLDLLTARPSPQDAQVLDSLIASLFTQSRSCAFSRPLLCFLCLYRQTEV